MRIDVNLTESSQLFDVTLAEGGSGNVKWGEITGTLSRQSDLQTALDSKAAAANVYTKTTMDSMLALKQGKLTAGNDITISSDDVISCTTQSAVWGNITGSITNQSDLQSALNSKGNLSGGNTWSGTQKIIDGEAEASVKIYTEPEAESSTLEITHGDTEILIRDWGNVFVEGDLQAQGGIVDTDIESYPVNSKYDADTDTAYVELVNTDEVSNKIVTIGCDYDSEDPFIKINATDASSDKAININTDREISINSNGFSIDSLSEDALVFDAGDGFERNFIVKNLGSEPVVTINSEGIQLENNGTITGWHDSTKLNASLKGAANGLAELDGNGKVPSSQLPSYVDDVLTYDSLSNFPTVGEDGKIYIAKDTNKQYRWSGTAYIEISSSLALGETAATAYRGDRGAAAYTHSQITSGNPHGTTKLDVGLGNVDNTSDANKPISTAVQSALSGKANLNDVPTKTSDLTNDSGFLTSHQDISGKADKSDTYTKSQVDSAIAAHHDNWGEITGNIEDQTDLTEIEQGNNLFDRTVIGDRGAVEDKGLNSTTGEPVNDKPGWLTSGFIKIEEGKSYEFYWSTYETSNIEKRNANICLYTANKIFIKGSYQSGVGTLTPSSNAAYFRVSQYKKYKNMVVYSTYTPTTYEPYYHKVHIKSGLVENKADKTVTDNINSKIPTQATAQNQLADKSFVNSSINSVTAYYITKNASGEQFATKAELNAATIYYSGGEERVPTRNDYCIVQEDETHEGATARYIYQNNQWEFQYVVNKTAFTSDQLAALNSGVTETIVSNTLDHLDDGDLHVSDSERSTWNAKQNAISVTNGTGTAATIENYSNNTASGNYAHAEGYGTKASGYASHAEGGGANGQTESKGYNSHAEGGDTIAWSRNSHSEGGDTNAYSKNSHAEGWNTEAGYNGTKKALTTTVSYPTNKACRCTSHQRLVIHGGEGYFRFDDDARVQALNFSVNDIFSLYTPTKSEKYKYQISWSKIVYINDMGKDNGLEIYVEKMTSFSDNSQETFLFVEAKPNVGESTINRYDKPYLVASNNIPDIFVGDKINMIATDGTYYQEFATVTEKPTSSKIGIDELMSSYENGWKIETTNGTDTTCYGGLYSHAEGRLTKATGDNSHAEGNGTEASGKVSHTEGYQTKATANNTHAEGYKSEANGGGAHAEGYLTKANTPYSHTEGYNTQVIYDTTYSGYEILGSGEDTTNKYLVVNGHAYNYFSTLGKSIIFIYEGQTNIPAPSAASGKTLQSKAEVNGEYRLYFNTLPEMEDDKRYICSYKTITPWQNGDVTFTYGGKYSHAEGLGTIAKGEAQLVAGKYNIADNTSLRITGKGTSNNSRANAEKLDANGNLYLAGNVYAQNTNKCLTSDDISGKADISGGNNFEDNQTINGNLSVNDSISAEGSIVSNTSLASEVIQIGACYELEINAIGGEEISTKIEVSKTDDDESFLEITADNIQLNADSILFGNNGTSPRVRVINGNTYLTSIINPINNEDAVNKQYVDTKIGNIESALEALL